MLTRSPYYSPVTAGITDGCASQLASGAINPGDWNSTIGTTLVIKGVTKSRIVDPRGRFYSHKHPEGYWMPGGASNTGADRISQEYGDDLDSWELTAQRRVPTNHLSYPLRQTGERFPLVAPEARGFAPRGISKEEEFVSNMEGVAYLERYSYEVAKILSGENVEKIYTAGGGSLSPTWLKIRSSVMNLPILRMKTITGAFGAAVLASSNTYFKNLTEAGSNLIQLDTKIDPDFQLSRHYEERYRAFIELLQDKNYLNQ